MHDLEQGDSKREENIIDKERFNQIRAGYYYLKRRELKDFLKGKPNKFSKHLPNLKMALLNYQQYVIEQAIQALSTAVITTKITSPLNNSRTPKKFLDLAGVAEPMTTIQIVVNSYRTYITKVDKNRKFVLKDIELNFGDNELVYYNEELFFISNQVKHLHIHLQSAYPFRGLNDPLTQKKFEDSEVNMIIRCKNCQNFMYDFSAEENGGECAMPNCYHKEFYTAYDMEFWD